jgi:hypothetical protein
MKRWILLVIVLAAVVAAFALEHQSSTPATKVGDQPVLVELFTSQGCSSCPPADELLRHIARDPSLRGRAIPLAFHVDYWDHLGWRDPFSSRTWTQRQAEYVRALHLESAYTPQVVINGSRQMVGSSSTQIYRAIEEESKRAPEGSVSVRREGENVVIDANAPHGGAELIVVAFEDGASTNVLRGENGGRTLANDSIARDLIRLGEVKGSVEKKIPMKLAAVAFLQDVKTRRVLAAAVTRPGA